MARALNADQVLNYLYVQMEMDDNLRTHALGVIGLDKLYFHCQDGQRYEVDLDEQFLCVHGDGLNDVEADADLDGALGLKILDWEPEQEDLMVHDALVLEEELEQESPMEQDDEVLSVQHGVNVLVDEDVDVIYGEVLVCQVNALELGMEHGAQNEGAGEQLDV